MSDFFMLNFWLAADQVRAETTGRAVDHNGFEVRNLREFIQKQLTEGLRELR